MMMEAMNRDFFSKMRTLHDSGLLGNFLIHANIIWDVGNCPSLLTWEWTNTQHLEHDHCLKPTSGVRTHSDLLTPALCHGRSFSSFDCGGEAVRHKSVLHPWWGNSDIWRICWGLSPRIQKWAKTSHSKRENEGRWPNRKPRGAKQNTTVTIVSLLLLLRCSFDWEYTTLSLVLASISCTGWRRRRKSNYVISRQSKPGKGRSCKSTRHSKLLDLPWQRSMPLQGRTTTSK